METNGRSLNDGGNSETRKENNGGDKTSPIIRGDEIEKLRSNRVWIRVHRIREEQSCSYEFGFMPFGRDAIWERS
ncbi:hypothetical protein P8452_76331 [Trifolium repens]|jgi:hypothetical protein|nr:hypothetical protein P8452_76331 [Trifolium repens]